MNRRTFIAGLFTSLARPAIKIAPFIPAPIRRVTGIDRLIAEAERWSVPCGFELDENWAARKTASDALGEAIIKQLKGE